MISDISSHQISPAKQEVFKLQGIKQGVKHSPVIDSLHKSALVIFHNQAEPKSIISELSISEFSEIYQGEGMNEKQTPVEQIYPKALRLALFAFTLGKMISEEISLLFKKKEFALGSMLDAVASAGTDKAAQFYENEYRKIILSENKAGSVIKVLLYSPGYCGWHISGQKKLFSYLHPETIGITLKDSFLMNPLKSISGVLIAGHKEIHNFEDSYSFCAVCQTHSCRQRMKQFQNENMEE